MTLRIDQLPYFSGASCGTSSVLHLEQGDYFSCQKRRWRVSVLAMPSMRGMFLLDIMKD